MNLNFFKKKPSPGNLLMTLLHVNCNKSLCKSCPLNDNRYKCNLAFKWSN